MSIERAPRPESKPVADPQLEPPPGAGGRTSGIQPKVGMDAHDRSLDQDVELSADQQKRILDLFSQLKTVSFYDLLGVPRAADKKEIKRAFNKRATEFHPDRFFRKRLGSFTQKMEAIFVRMTEAHDLLCSPERRAEYDEALRANRASLIEVILERSAADTINVERTAPPPPTPPTPRPAMSPAEAQARRHTLARRLMGSRPVSTSPPKKG